MNELVGPDRGFLIPIIRQEPRHLGFNYYIDPAGLAECVEEILKRPNSELSAQGDRARWWFEENDRRFRSDFPPLIARLLAGA